MPFQPIVSKETARGADGKMVLSNKYSNGRYSVTIQPDGAIRVKSGDWLSKYSAALHNDYTQVHEYARMDRNGKLQPIHNVDQIRDGELLYHIPTYKQTHVQRMRMDPVLITGVVLSEDDKKDLIVDTVEREFGFEGEALHLLEEAAHYLHYADGGVQVAEVAGLIAEGTAVATAATIFSIVSGFLTSIAAIIASINANESDRAVAGLQAIWYTMTAWAFDDKPIPPRFPNVLRSRVLGFVAGGTYGLSRVEPAWNASAQSLVRHLEADVTKKKVQKESYQQYWQSIGDHDRRKLAGLFADKLREQVDRRSLELFDGLDPDEYPNNKTDYER